ncbi:hypothetical protein GCM10027051_05670 [Niabella terrae]
MNSFVRLSFLWFSITVCYILHNIYHLSELFFGIDIKLPDAAGEVPMATHLFRLLVDLSVLVFFLTSLYGRGKRFFISSYVWAMLLLILNIVHLGGTIASEWKEYSQLALLSFIVVLNLMLLLESRKCWKLLRQSPAVPPA